MPGFEQRCGADPGPRSDQGHYAPVCLFNYYFIYVRLCLYYGCYINCFPFKYVLHFEHDLNMLMAHTSDEVEDMTAFNTGHDWFIIA